MHQCEAHLTSHTCEGEIDQHVIIVEIITWNSKKGAGERANKMRESVKVEHCRDKAKTVAVKIVVLNTTPPQAPQSENRSVSHGVATGTRR